MRLPLADQHRMGTVTDNGQEPDRRRTDRDSLARSAFRRSARLASLPLSFAGRSTLNVQYQYESVNGRPVSAVTAPSSAGAPSVSER